MRTKKFQFRVTLKKKLSIKSKFLNQQKTMIINLKAQEKIINNLNRILNLDKIIYKRSMYNQNRSWIKIMKIVNLKALSPEKVKKLANTRKSLTRLKVKSNKNFLKKRKQRLQKFLLRNLRTTKVTKMVSFNLLKIKKFQLLTSMKRLTQEILFLNQTPSSNHLTLSSICLMLWITTSLSTSRCQSVICRSRSLKQSTVEMKMLQ